MSKLWELLLWGVAACVVAEALLICIRPLMPYVVVLFLLFVSTAVVIRIYRQF